MEKQKSNILKQERYEIFWETISKNDGIAIDVCPDGQDPFTKKPCLVFMSEDKGETERQEQGHQIWGYIEFENKECLELAQMSLNLLRRLIYDEQEKQN